MDLPPVEQTHAAPGSQTKLREVGPDRATSGRTTHLAEMWRFEQRARVGVVDKGRDEEIRKQQRAQWSQLLSQLHPHFCRRFLQFALHFRDSYQIE